MKSLTPFLTFQGDAEQAIRFYQNIFAQTEILEMLYQGEDSLDPGKIQMARIKLMDQTLMIVDSSVKHEWDFSPAISFFVECDFEDEIDTMYQYLKENGEVLMELSNYGFSTKFAWVQDQFGISRQLNFQ